MSRCADCGTPGRPGEIRCPRCNGPFLSGPGRGRARRIDPLAIVLLALMAVVTVAILLPGTHGHPQPAYRARCRSHLRQIVLACLMYADDNEGFLPDSLERLVPLYLADTRVLARPRAADKSQASYVLVPGLRDGMPGDFILAYEVSLDNHGGAGRSVAFLDTSSEWWRADRDAELRQRLAEQAERLSAWVPAQEHLEREGVK